MKNIHKFTKAILGILLASVLITMLGLVLTGESKEMDTTLANLTHTLEIKASDLKTAKEDEQAKKSAYDLSVKTREVKQEEKKVAMDSINTYINSGLNKSEKPINLEPVSFQKSEK